MDHTASTPAPTHQQISAWAIAAAACSIFSTLACIGALIAAMMASAVFAGAILALPALGLAGAICGGVALRQIGRSQGRIGGKPLALVGVFVGLMSAVLQGAAVLGSIAAYAAVPRLIVPAVSDLARRVEAHDLSAARALLSPSASGVTPDERLTWFFDGLAEHQGKFAGATFGLGTLGATRELTQRAQTPKTAPPPQTPKPVELLYQRGRVLLLVSVDESALQKQQVLILDLLAVEKDGVARTLLPAGPASVMARWLGLRVEEAPAAVPAPAPAESPNQPPTPAAPR